MAYGRSMPSARSAKRAPAAVPSAQKSMGPSKKPSMPGVKSPAKQNLGAAIKRTSDQPKV